MRILIADDHDLFRDLVSIALSRTDPGYQVEVVANVDAAEAVLSGGTRFDLILLDIKMPGMNPRGGIRRLSAVAPDTPIAVMSGVADVSEVRSYLADGARGYIPKTLSLEQLCVAIASLGQGMLYLPNEFARSWPGEPESGRRETCHGVFGLLTTREQQILELLTNGFSNKLISRHLEISEATVKTHMMNLFRKIGARSRTDAVRLALAAPASVR